MKLLLLTTLAIAVTATAQEADHDHEHEIDTTNLITLTPQAVENLGLETAKASHRTLSDTAFAIGRIAEIPTHHAVLSSRIPGRITELKTQEGDIVTKGQVLTRVESRQPGNPPPTIDLKAPISGLVVLSHVRLGEPVEPEKELLDISDLSEVYAIASVPEHQAGQLRDSRKANIKVPATGDQTIPATLLRFGTSANSTSGTIDAIFQLPNPGSLMRPDMRAEFDLILNTRENALCVPTAAIQGGPSDRHVFVAHPELPHTFSRVYVRTGATNRDFTEILRGLDDHDTVVTTGSYQLDFVGTGNASLKELLDAAHGHEHNEDGSEKTTDGDEHADHDQGCGHDHGAESPTTHQGPRFSPLEYTLAATTLLCALLAAALYKKQS